MDQLNDEFKKHLNLSFTEIGLKTHTPKAKTLRILISSVSNIIVYISSDSSAENDCK